MERYGRLTILKDEERINYRRRVECQCDCGSVKNYYYQSIKLGHTKSCGCYKKESLQLSIIEKRKLIKVIKEKA